MRKKVKTKYKDILLCLVTFVVCLSLTACGFAEVSEEQRRLRDEQLAQAIAERDEAQAAYEEFNAPVQLAMEAMIQESLQREIANDLSQLVRFSEENYQNLRSVTEGLDVVYPYAEWYFLDEALARYDTIEHISTPLELRLLSALPMSGEELYSIVKKNNDTFFEIDGGRERLHNALDDDYLQWVCEIFADAITHELTNYDFHQSTIYDLEYRLLNLRIVHPYWPTNLGSVSPDGLLTIIAGDRFFFGSTAEQTAVHELVHLIQLRSNEAQEASGFDTIYGFNFLANDLAVNSLTWRWFTEASAERLAADLFTGKALTYSRAVEYLDILTLTQIVDSDVHLQAVPRLTQQPYLETAFELFGLDSSEQQLEFLQMMFAIELVANLVHESIVEYFWELYGQSVLGREPDEFDRLELQRRLNGSIFTTISKYFYENLAQRLISTAIPLEDIFEYIIIFEASINTVLGYTDRERNELRQQFFADYAVIQETFFQQIADVLDAPVKDLLADYDSINTHTETIPPPNLLSPREEFLIFIDYSWLDTDKNMFLTSMYDDVMVNKTISLRQMAEIWKGL